MGYGCNVECILSVTLLALLLFACICLMIMIDCKEEVVRTSKEFEQDNVFLYDDDEGDEDDNALGVIEDAV